MKATPRTSAGLGKVEPDEYGQIFGTGYDRFESPLGIRGLAREEGKDVHILAVIAMKPGTGQFREFIRHCQATYAAVFVWEDWNPLVTEALQRWGFQADTCTDAFGETLAGWKWTKPTN